jgi:hypothetical protein
MSIGAVPVGNNPISAQLTGQGSVKRTPRNRQAQVLADTILVPEAR